MLRSLVVEVTTSFDKNIAVASDRHFRSFLVVAAEDSLAEHFAAADEVESRAGPWQAVVESRAGPWQAVVENRAGPWQVVVESRADPWQTVVENRAVPRQAAVEVESPLEKNQFAAEIRCSAHNQALVDFGS